MKTQLLISFFYLVAIFPSDLEKALMANRDALVIVADKALLAGCLRMETEVACPAVTLATYDDKGNYRGAHAFTLKQFLTTFTQGETVRHNHAYLVYTKSRVYYLDLRGDQKASPPSSGSAKKTLRGGFILFLSSAIP